MFTTLDIKDDVSIVSQGWIHLKACLRKSATNLHMAKRLNGSVPGKVSTKKMTRRLRIGYFAPPNKLCNSYLHRNKKWTISTRNWREMTRNQEQVIPLHSNPRLTSNYSNQFLLPRCIHSHRCRTTPIWWHCFQGHRCHRPPGSMFSEEYLLLWNWLC